MENTAIMSWYYRQGYAGAVADLIQAEVAKLENKACAKIFFSAHGVPKSYVEEAGDPCKGKMERCVKLIAAQLRKRGATNHPALAYQARFGPVE